jgi:hypothetical protein
MVNFQLGLVVRKSKLMKLEAEDCRLRKTFQSFEAENYKADQHSLLSLKVSCRVQLFLEFPDGHKSNRKDHLY